LKLEAVSSDTDFRAMPVRVIEENDQRIVRQEQF
jgi:hypothetical protein